MKNIILVILVLLVLVGGYVFFSNNDPVNTNEPDQENETTTEGLTTEQVVRNKSEEVLVSVGEENIDAFKNLIHPTEGVRFSKDGVVLPNDDQRLTSSEIDSLVGTNETLMWGYADGSGLPIEKTFTEYFSDLAAHDYENAPQTAYNNALRGGANTIINIEEEYPNSYFTSHHYPHTATYVEENGEEVPLEMSWVTLNLVFEEYQGDYYLVGVVEDNWTI